MKIYLIRHGKLDWKDNIKKCIGVTDIELNDEGIKKAEEITEFLKDKNIKKIFTSDLKRCEETGQIVSKFLEIPYYVEEQLREINMGIWENKSFEYIKTKYPIEYEKRGNNIANYRIKNGETFSECYKRVVNFFYRVSNDNYGNNIVIITHSGVIKCLMCFIKNIKLNNVLNIKLDYGDVLCITYDKKQYKFN